MAEESACPNTLFLIVILDGVKVTDYAEGDPVRERRPDQDSERGRRPDQGWIGLQGYNRDEAVFFKEVAMRPLEARE